MVVAVSGYSRLIESAASGGNSAQRRRFLAQARNEESLVAEYLLLRAAEGSAVPEVALAVLTAAVGMRPYAQEPAWFTTAPVGAIRKLHEQMGWSERDVDLYEINEAFAVVTMAAMEELKLPHEKVNVHGGACALGHPIGASGARILVTLLHALEKYGLKRGIAALCIGGGEATAVAVERM